MIDGSRVFFIAMAKPFIVNKSPLSGASDVGASTPITLGLRDADTRVNLSSVFASIVYSTTSYTPVDVIPTSTTDLSAVFSTFNDVAGAAEPRNPADQVIVSGLYQIERTEDGNAEEGFLYLYETAPINKPVAISATLLPSVTSTGSFDYVEFEDWTGMLVGLIHWPLNKGIFLFFRDDGGSAFGKYVTLAGPATSESGERSTFETDTAFDWSSDTWTYKILWDDTPGRRLVTATAISSDGTTEVLLAEADIGSIETFRGSFSLGHQGANSGVVMLVVGNDGRQAADRLDILGLALYAFGGELVQAGGSVSSSTVDVTANSLLLLDQTADGWSQVGTGELGDGLAITRAADSEADTFMLTRAEPDLARQEWLFIFIGTVDNSVHSGSYNSGIGLDIDDGMNRFTIRLLDNFDTTASVGLLTDASKRDIFEGYASVEEDWQNDAMQIILLGSASLDSFRVFYGEDESSIISGSYSSVVASTGTESVSIGFLDSSGVCTGTMTVTSAWLFQNVTFFTRSALPEDEGWTVVQEGSTLTSELAVAANVLGAYYIAYITSPGYVRETGATLYVKASATAWTDEVGALSPIGPIGPVGAICVPGDEGTRAVLLYFYKASSGETYVCLPHSDEDFDEVSRQTAAGQLMSWGVDFTEPHVYILVVNPKQHIRLYMDYSPSPVIDVAWENAADVLNDLPAHLPESDGDPVVGAFGSLHEDHGALVAFSFVRLAVGTGYDLSMSLALTDDELSEHVYGARAETFIDFSDED